jgi:hypothetical protein
MNGLGSRGPATSDDRRGQTLVDYVAGVSVFFITIAFILGLMPSFVTPYQSDAAGQDTAKAERIAENLVTNLSTDGAPNRLDVTELTGVLALPQTDLANRYGLRDHEHVNITVTHLNGSGYVENTTAPPGITLTSDVTYDGGSSGTAVRVVTLNNQSATCTPACRLLVRVW